MTPRESTMTPPADDVRARLLQQRLAGGGRRARAGIEPADRSGTLPLSFGQEQMWFLSRLDPGSTEYLVPVSFRLSGPLDEAALGRAWDAMVERHEILRTRHVLTGTEPEQVIDAPRPGTLAVTRAVDEAEAREVVEGECAQPFDLATDWPTRATLVRIAADDHVLLLVSHHISCDAWSTGILMSELATAYGAFAEGRELPPAPPALQYADFAAWQRGQASGDRFARQLSYWKSHLSGLEPLELPLDRPRPAVRGHGGAEVDLVLPEAVADRVRAVADAQDTTVFTVLLAAYQLLLGRYTGRRDVAVGTIVSGRNRPELQGMLGYGVNTLVLKAGWHAGDSFAELVAAARRGSLDAYDNQAVPFARVVAEVEPERDLSRTPVYQAVFTLHEGGGAGPALPGITAEPFLADGGVARCDLELQVRDQGAGPLVGRLIYATDLFDRATVARMGGHLVRLLDELTAAPARPLSALELLDDGERQRFLAAGRGAQGAPYRSALERFTEQAAATPDAPAVTGAGTASFGELDDRAGIIAGRLARNGVGVESVVGVLLDRGPELLAAMLGAWRAGGGYVPLDPEYPAERWLSLLADSGAEALVTDRARAALIAPDFDGTIVVVDEEDAAADDDAADAPGPRVLPDPDALAYIIYTSGSTGRPKGVQISHASLAVHLDWVLAEYIGDARRGPDGPGRHSTGAPLFSTVSSDVVVPVLYAPLLAGLPVHMLPQDLDLADLGGQLSAGAPYAFVKLTPGHLEMLGHQLADDQVDGLAHVVVTGGDALLGPAAERWDLRLGAGRLINEYGPTEITVGNSTHPVAGPQREVVPIGLPIPGTTMYVLDESLNPVPPGVVGEVCVGGTGVARGYAGRPDATAEKFVPDPFGAPGSRIYRTGDLGRVLADGSVEFAGRVDRQLKIRGYRVEPAEVEAALTAHPGVTEARVLAVDGRLAAYYVPAGAEPTAAELRDWLSRTLPDYMVPGTFQALERIPLTPVGKLDVAALPAPGPAPDAVTTAPRTPLEEQVAAVWAEVLGVAEVGVHDSFFDLGGDSIRAVALVGALREAGHDVSVRDVFAHHSVAALCELLAARPALAAGQDEGVAPFALVSDEDRARLPEGATDAYPLSQNQIGMLVEMLADEQNSYHNVTSFRIKDPKPFSLDAWREAARIAVARHEILRTSLHLSGYSVPMQVVHGQAVMPVGMEELGPLPEDELQQALAAYAARDRAELFDLNTPTLMRVFAHVTDDGGYWLSITECHPILEGWGHHTLIMELLDLYDRLRDGREVKPFEHPAVRFADFVAAELRSIDSDEDRAYWKGVTSGYAPMRVPAGWGDPALPVGSRYLVRRTPWSHLEDGLRRLASAADASLKSVMVAAYTKVMSQLTDEAAFHTGLICDARPEAVGADTVYGMYLNTLPFPVDRGARTWRDLVARTFAREVELWPHRRFPLAQIQRDVPGRQRLVNIYFNYQDFRQVDTDLVGMAGTDDSPTEFPLTVSSRVGHIWVTADPRFVDERNADRIAAMFAEVLESMAADPEGDAQAIRLPEGEREQLAAWTAKVRTPLTLDVPEEIAGFVRRTPDAPALTDDTGTLTYRELDERAGRLARRFADAGAGPETVVALCMDRSAELVVAVLAVLKAGAAWLPLDPSLPVDRLGFMLADSGAGLLVTGRGAPEGLSAEHVLGHEALTGLDDGPVLAGRPVDPGHLAYVIYTSGSTGRPKGVQVHRRGMGNHLLAKIEDLGLTAADSTVQNASQGFDISVWQMLAGLVTGGVTRVVDQTVVLDPKALFDLADDESVTVLEVVPSLLRAALDLWDLNTPAPGLGALRWLVVTGEELPPDLCVRWFARFPEIPLVNAYGPTECSDDITHAILTSQDAPADRVPIGKVVRNTELHVLDGELRPVPAGVAGELYAGGVGVARGYGGRPALTAERFVPDPFSGRPGDRLYRTGDLARWRADGSLEYLGRIDDQVKIRGHRVELGEIETAITATGLVRNAVVAVREGQPIAYVVADEEVDPAALKAALAPTLPEYMIPAAFVVLDAVPLTPNGKVDRKALPAPGSSAFTQEAYVEPRTVLERRVVAAWLDALPVDRVGVENAFFDLGGDSIRAVTLVGVLRAEGLDVTVRDIFQLRTVAALCAALEERPLLDEAAQQVVAPFALLPDEDRALLPDGLTDAYPLAQNQIGMAVEMLSGDGRDSYHDVTSFRIKDESPFDADAFRRAVDELTARHEMMRTSVHLTGWSVPLQLVHERAHIPVEVRDLRGAAAGEVEAVLLGMAGQGDLFDLTRAPLMRMTVLLEPDGHWTVVFTQAHLITEGWTYHRLLMELVTCYRRIRDGLAPEPYRAPAVRYADFVAEELTSLASADDRAYWEDVLRDRVPFVFPDSWGGAGEDDAGDTGDVVVGLADLRPALRQLAADSQASLKSVLLAAFVTVMGALTDERDVHVGLVCDTRPERIGADRVHGMYLNTVPFPVDRDAKSWRDLVQSVFRQEVGLWPHRRYPMSALQRGWRAGRLIDTIFNFVDFHGVDTEMVDGGRGGSLRTEFGLNVIARPDRLGLSHDPRAVSRERTELIGRMLRAVLEAMAADPLGDAQVPLVAGPGPVAEPAAPAVAVTATLHELVGERAVRHPRRTAVVAQGVTLPYAELDRRADLVAGRLAARGVRAGDVVGVHVERGADLVVGLLGVLRSGAAFLPLDPALPTARLTAYAVDAGARVAVTGPGLGLPGLVGVSPADGDGPVPAVAARAGERAYVIYTSGSTGHPKGVAVGHAQAVSVVTAALERLGVAEGDVWAMTHSPAFDVSVFEVFGALLSGGTLVVPDLATTRSPRELLALIGEHGVGVLCQTPTALRGLTELVAQGAQPGLRTVVLAGEKVHFAELAPWAGRLEHTAFFNLYGPTEATVYATAHRITADDIAGNRRSVIGRPLRGVLAEPRDAAGRPVPDGVPGELYLGGVGVAEGYFGDTAATAERFVTGAVDGPAGRWFRTGDRVRRLADGALEFLGRSDDQVKIRGHRVEPGEVTTALLATGLATEAAVVAVDGELVAYVVAPGAGPAELRAALARVLPEPMIPAAYVRVERVPRTVTGKVERRGLPAPGPEAYAKAARVAARTPLEERVVAAWRAVLPVAEVGVEDDFFDLGGNSIRAYRATEALRREGVDVTVREVFTYRTAARLCAALA
ncbi:non-ribosomal peptide synthetase [Streptomyces sp. VRA16 Mangrove soil]|uniref:non-ribosomal peptide synthetase n=1 Tax=Streptomyces sp. VRA16 Mangrove soil TaxID=2817434 RepID=UPI001A9FC2AF|nr:non-ribosomal peptide synthetase [Streptomyces sp. VRA16 Mangrove soil]MBO1334079.1 amino acid adenylation domain-containing protein [Streptomyces sp. VRA16 Mangrove soil]